MRNMDNRISVLDINIDKLRAKEAMKYFIEFLETEALDVIELVTVESLMQMDESPGLKESIGDFELVLAGETTILESAGISDKTALSETDRQVFLKMILRYLHRNHRRVYLLVDTQEQGEALYDYLGSRYYNVQVGGMAKVAAGDRADDMIVNAVNGADVDCVISLMSSPLREDFVLKNKSRLNARVWLGIGTQMPLLNQSKERQGRLTSFVIRKLFRKEVERRKRDISNSPAG